MLVSLVFFCCQTRYTVLTFSHLKLVFTIKNIVIKSYQIEVSVLQSFSVHKTARIGTNSPFRLESSSSDGDGCQTERKQYNTETVQKVSLHDRRAVQKRELFLAATTLQIQARRKRTDAQ